MQCNLVMRSDLASASVVESDSFFATDTNTMVSISQSGITFENGSFAGSHKACKASHVYVYLVY